MTEDDAAGSPGTSSGKLIREVAVLQLKLIVDGFRDLVLVPASLIAGVVSLVTHDGGRRFYNLLQLGRDSERWINLFGALDRRGEDESAPAEDIDRLVDRVETFVRREVETGEMTGQARERLARAAEKLQQAARREDK